MIEDVVKWMLYVGIMGTALSAVLITIHAMVMGRKPALSVGWCLVMLGVLFLLAQGRYQARLVVIGSVTTGQISEVLVTKGGIRPVVQFTDERGEQIAFRGASVGKRGYYTEGQTVTVRYLASNPQFAEVQSWWSLWQPMLISTVVASVCIAFGTFLIRVGRALKEQPNQGGRPTLRTSKAFIDPEIEAIRRRGAMQRLRLRVAVGISFACFSFFFFVENTTTLHCERADVQQINCQLTRQMFGPIITRSETIQGLIGANVEQRPTKPGTSIVDTRVVLRTIQGDVVLTPFEASGNGNLANDINGFVDSSQQRSFTTNHRSSQPALKYLTSPLEIVLVVLVMVGLLIRPFFRFHRWHGGNEPQKQSMACTSQAEV